MTKKCPNCGKSIENDAKFCVNCGSKQSEIKEAKTTTVETTNKVPVNGLSITGFVLSLVSLLCCGLISPLGLIFSIIGLAKGDEEDRTGKGLAIAGIIVSAIMLVLFILMLVIWNGFFQIIEDVINNSDLSEWNNIITYGFLVK